jgi:hypothetical protein
VIRIAPERHDEVTRRFPRVDAVSEEAGRRAS